MAEYKTLIQIYQSDSGLQKEFPNMTGKGISGEWTLNDWYNRYGKVDYPNITLVQPGDPRLKTPTPTPTVKGDDDKNILTRFQSDPTPNDNTTNESTVFLFNRTSKTYIPIKNPESLMKLLRVDTAEEAFKHVNVLPVSAMDSPEWQGSFGSFSTAIGEDGQVPESPSIIPGTEIVNLNHYGHTKIPAVEDGVMDLINGLMSRVKGTGYISEKVFKDNLENPTQLAKYVDALAYGFYDIVDNVYKDLRAKTLFEEGRQEYANFKAFDENLDYNDWKNTPEGKEFFEKIKDNSDFDTPPELDFIDWEGFNNPIFDIPGAAFQTLVKPIDPTSPEFKAEAEEIQASYYDIMTQKAEAETEQAKAIADHNWEIFKKNLEKKHGLELSNNAKTAWGQLQDLFSGTQQAGLSGTGIEREIKDKYMKDIRDRDQLLREGKIDEEEMELRNKLLNSGNPEDIAKFVEEHGKEKAELWGLIPSPEMEQWFSKEGLEERYPDMSEAEIENVSRMMIDPTTGFYQSKLYQNLYSNKYQLGEEKKGYQWDQLIERKKIEEEEAYAQYTKRNPLLKLKDTLGEEFVEKDKDVTETFTPDPTSNVPTSQQSMRDAVKKHVPTSTISTSLPSAPTSQQTMRDIVQKKVPSQPKAPVVSKTAITTSTYAPTLLDTYNKRKDVQTSFAKRFPGVNPTVMGTEANRKLNEWWSSTGQKEAADMVKKGWSGN